MKTGLKDRVCRVVERLSPELAAINRDLYEHPEPGYQERYSCELLASRLEQGGFALEMGIAGLPTAFRATGHGKGSGPRVALLAEYDALPGVGHGCGHNIIGTAAVGAALAVAEVLPELPGTVIVLGCPAEEGGVEGAGGKVVLAEQGAFAGVEAALMIHPSTRNIVVSGSTAREALEATFTGERSLSDQAVALLFDALNALRAAFPPEMRIHGITVGGGEGRSPSARVYVRARDGEQLGMAVARVDNCIQGAALALGLQGRRRLYTRTYESLKPNRVLAELFTANLRELGLYVDPPESRGSGSTDMGNISRLVPAIHPYIAIADHNLIPHSREFAAATISERGQRGLVDGAKALAMTVVDLLAEPGLLEAAREAFREGRNCMR